MALKVGELYASFGIDSKGISKDISGIEKQCSSIGKSLAITGAALTASVTRPIVNTAKDIVKTGASFDGQMSRVKAIAQATDAEFETLRNTALEWAGKTKFTAQETGEAMEYMGMAGWKADQMVAGLPAILALAAASGEDLGTTSDIVTDGLTAFGLKAEDASRFADVLAAASVNANTNVSMMGESFKFVGPLAGSMGYSIEDTAVALGLMANSGIKATMAGTSLRNIIQNMQTPTKSQAEAMKKLGLSLTDAKGGTKSLMKVMKEMRQSAKKAGIDTVKLHDEIKKYDEMLNKGTISEEEYDAKLSEMTKGAGDFMAAVSDLAGARGLSGMLAIMNSSDEDFDKFVAAIRDSDGEAQRLMGEMLDNLEGDMIIFDSALNTLKIRLYDLFSDDLRNVVQEATKYVDAFSNMDSETQKLVVELGGIAAAAGPAVAAIGGLIAALPKVAPALRAIVSPAGIAAGSLALFAIAAVDADNKVGQAFDDFATKAAASLENSQADIESYISTVSDRIPALAASITSGLGKLVPAVVGVAGSIVSSFIKVVSDNANDVSQIGVTLVTGLVNSIATEIEKHDMIAETATMLTNLSIAFIKNTPKIFNSGVRLGSAIIRGIMNTDWGALAVDLGNAIVTAVGEVDIPALEDLATNIIEAISAGMDTENWDGIRNFVKDIAGRIANFDWTEAGDKASAMATSLIEAIGNGIETAGDNAATIIDALGTILTGNFGSSFLPSATKIATNIIMAIAGQIPRLTSTATSIIKSLGNLIKDIPWSEAGSAAADIATSLIDAITDAIIGNDDIEGSDMTALVDALADGISAAVDGLSDAASALVTGLIGYLDDHGDELIEAGGRLAWSITKGAIKVGGAMAKGIADVINTGIYALQGKEYDPVVEAARDAFMTLNGRIPQVYESTIGNITGGQIVENLSAPFRDKDSWDRALASWGAMVEAGAAEYFPEFAWYGNEAAVEMFDGLSSALKNGDTDQAIEQAALAYATGFSENFSANLKKSNRSVYDGMNELLTGSIELVNLSEIADKQGFDLGKALGVNIPDGVAIGVKEGVAGLQIGEDWFPAFGTLASGYDLSKMLSENWYAAFATSLKGLEGYQNELTSTLESLGVSAIGAMNIDVPEGFGDYLAEQIKNGTLSVEGAAEELLQLVFGVKTDLQAAFEGLDGDGALEEAANSASAAATAASTEVKTAMDEMAKATTEGLSGVASGISSKQTEAQQAANTVQNAVVQEFLANMSEANGKTIGETWVTAISTAIGSGDLATPAKTISQAAIDAASAALSAVAGNTIGKQFSNGIAAGIRAGSGVIISAAKSAALAAYNTARNTLGIHSPSKLANRDIGQMFDAGIAGGVIDNLISIERATERVRDVLMEQQYVGEPSRNTIHTARQSVQETEAAMMRVANVRALPGNGEKGEQQRLVQVTLVLDGQVVGTTVAPLVDEAIGAEIATRR